jgi:hypothetical protein
MQFLQPNVVVFLPNENNPTILVVDSPSLAHNKPIDLEHPSHGEAYSRRNFKEREAISTSQTGSSTTR